MMEGPGADSEEKHEPVSDIDIAVVDSLKCLTPNGRLEKQTRYAPLLKSPSCHNKTCAPTVCGCCCCHCSGWRNAGCGIGTVASEGNCRCSNFVRRRVAVCEPLTPDARPTSPPQMKAPVPIRTVLRPRLNNCAITPSCIAIIMPAHTLCSEEDSGETPDAES
jgi:hypothetical protein